MQGNDIPTAPHGYDRNVYFGASTQCYQRAVNVITGSTFATTITLGTWSSDGGIPTTGTYGSCNINLPSGAPLNFTTVNSTIANVRGNADCFDLTLNYGAFTDEGRGSISADRRRVYVELFFSGQATGHRCASADAGFGHVTVNGQSLLLDAVQKYDVTP